jgi:ribonuclease D
MAHNLKEDEVDAIVTTDILARVGRMSSGGATEDNILKQVIRASAALSKESSELSASGQFSVLASLPGVSNSLSECSSAMNQSLVSLLAYVTGGEVYASDARDWEFVEDTLDSIYARIDESLLAVSGGGSELPHNVPHLINTLDSSPSPSRPQDAWKVDNSRRVFVPLIPEKLNAIEPLDPLIIKARSSPESPSQHPFPNVYETEIKFALKSEIEKVSLIDLVPEPQFPSSLESTPLVHVSTESGLDLMISEILSLGEVAIDLEHHDIHSYRGFTCLIQLSTRDKDYIVHPFPLFESLHRMNQFTTDPRIEKVLHGSDMDIQWLQRDFGVYVVNMFDTGQAARVVGLSGGFGLANLLASLCSVSTNKAFQVSDWRTRPLPEDMVKYARLDTHYLLYIRDKLRGILLTMGGGGGVTTYGRRMLIQCLEKSAGISMKVYIEPVSDCQVESDHICIKAPALRVGGIRTNPKMMAALRAVLRWRDTTARRLDESRFHVLSNAAVLRLANALPSNTAQILRTLSFEKSNSFMPAMYISTEHADEIMAELEREWAKVEVVAKAAVVVEEKNSVTHSSAVVYAGQFGRVVGTSNTTRVTRPESAVDQSMVNSPLFALLSKNSPTTGSADNINSVMESIRDMFRVEIVAPPAGVMEPEIDIATVPVETQFVPFTSAKRKIDWDAGEMPPTVVEQTKNDGGRGQRGKATKRAATAPSSAAAKALAFVEKELSLSKK